MVYLPICFSQHVFSVTHTSSPSTVSVISPSKPLAPSWRAATAARAQGAVGEGGEGGAAPFDLGANQMRAMVLSGLSGDHWEVGPRSAAELREAATHYEQAAALTHAPALTAEYAAVAEACRSDALDLL